MIMADSNPSDSPDRHLGDIDPDANFSFAYESEYHTYDQLQISNLSNNSPLSLCHANIRSAPKNLHNLIDSFSLVNTNFSILALTETWLNSDNASLFNIPNYNHIHLTRNNRGGGGVSIHLHNSFVYSKRDDLTSSTLFYEILSIEILRPSASNLIVVAIYRPPNVDISEFLSHLTSMLVRIDSEKKPTFILGDFNLDLLKRDTNSDIQTFLDLMYSSSFLPLINKPTRVTADSATLIDNIFTNNLSQHHSIGILLADISDHYPIFTYLKELLPPKQAEIKYRAFNEVNRNTFREQIQLEDWSRVYETQNAQEAYTHFSETISQLYETNFPVKIRKSVKSDENPWLTTGLKKSIKKKNRLYTKYRQRPNSYYRFIYNTYKKILTKLIALAKKKHYEFLITSNRDNPRKTWQILNKAIGRDNCKTPLKIAKINNQLCTDTEIIANSLNDYFINVGKNLDSKIPQSDVAPYAFLTGNYPNSFFIAPVNESEVLKYLNMLKNSSAGVDKLKPEIIKSISRYIASPLAYIMNLCFEQSIVPDQLKQAYITPIFKSGDPSLFSNYRPISVLSVFSKIFERLLHNRLIKYFDENNILEDSQFGFRKSYSTELALAYTLDRITTEIDNKNHVIGLFLDFRKAFDTVNHEILLKKLYHYGIRGNQHRLISNYLNQRSQIVKIENKTSILKEIDIGVPQGSILGPLFFIIYINDLKNALNSCFPVMYADDTNIFISGKNIDSMTNEMNIELQNLSKYLQSNRLSLNTDKTHTMVFSTNTDIRNYAPPIFINNIPIQSKPTTSFLGVKITNSLSWSEHITHVRNKISKSIGIIKKVSKVFNRNTLLSLYKSLVLPYLQYCNIIWGNAPTTHLHAIHVLQKKALRHVHCLTSREHSAPYFVSCNLLNIFDIYKISCITFFYKLLHGIHPIFISTHFKNPILTFTSDNPSLSLTTRGMTNNTIRLPKYRTSLKQNFFPYAIIKLYNEFLLPLELLETCITLKQLKKHVTTILIAEY